MYIRISPDGCELRDVDVFTDFHFEVTSGNSADVDEVPGVAAIDDSQASVELATIFRLAGPKAGDPVWLRKFNIMVDYAQDQGWVNEKGSILGHIEGPDDND